MNSDTNVLKQGTLIHGVRNRFEPNSLAAFDGVVSKGILTIATLLSQQYEPNSRQYNISLSMLAEDTRYSGISEYLKHSDGSTIAFNEFWKSVPIFTEECDDLGARSRDGDVFLGLQAYRDSASNDYSEHFAVVLKDDFVKANASSFNANGIRFLMDPLGYGANPEAVAKFVASNGGIFGIRDKLERDWWKEHVTLSGVDELAFFHGIKIRGDLVGIVDEVIYPHDIPPEAFSAIIIKDENLFQHAEELIASKGLDIELIRYV